MKRILEKKKEFIELLEKNRFQYKNTKKYRS
jgi:hypothetical protein